MGDSVSLTGKDTTVIGPENGERVLSNFANGDVVNIDLPNDLIGMITGKNGATIIALNETGKNATVTLRVLLGSSDDKFLNSERKKFLRDPAAYELLNGEFTKRVGDGKGNVTSVIYKMGGGVISKIPVVKENKEGDVEQSVAIHTIMYANTERDIS